jgi:hypothetical protein
LDHWALVRLPKNVTLRKAAYMFIDEVKEQKVGSNRLLSEALN